MSTADFTSLWIERASDWANPILVKETRQSLKSRQFVITFMLLLAASWVVAVLGLMMSGDAIEFGSAGRQFFSVFYLVLLVAVLVVVPFGAYRSLLSEHDQHTFDLLSITTLSPRQVVWGKLASALVQVFIFYSAITPFIAFASLLEGFDLARAAYLLIVALLLSVGFSMTALLLAAIARERQWQSMMSLSVISILVSGFFSCSNLLFVPVAFDDADFWWISGFALLAGASYFILFQRIAIAQLTFESDNRSSAIRLTCSVQFWLLWICYFGYCAFRKTAPATDELLTLFYLSVVHWSIVGLMATTEEDSLSHRIRRRLPRNRLVRAILVPLMPGGARGYLYLLGHVAALWIILIVSLAIWDAPRSGIAAATTLRRLATFEPAGWTPSTQAVTAVCCYLVIYTGIATTLGRWGRSVSSELRRSHVRLMTFLTVTAGIIATLLLKAMRLTTWGSYSILEIINPVATIQETLRGGPKGTTITVLLAVVAGLVIVLNARAILRGVLLVVGNHR